MKFGVLNELEQRKPWDDNQEFRTFWNAIDQVKQAEAAGFDYAWTVEHHFLSEYSHSSAPEVFLAAAAQHTSTIRLGHGVLLTAPGFNHTFRTAERLATLDIACKGRLEFGAGRSVTTQELHGFGIATEDSRPSMLEGLREIPRMWTNEVYPGTEGRTKYIDLPAREVLPKPLQQPHPRIYMACTNPESFALAGKLGVGILCFVVGHPDRLKPLIDIYREAITEAEPIGAFKNEHVAAFTIGHCADSRQDAEKFAAPEVTWYVERLAGLFTQVAGKPGYEAYEQILGDMMGEYQALAEKYHNDVRALTELGVVCIGDPRTCSEVTSGYQAQGIDQFITLQQFGRLPHGRVMRSLQLMGEQVIPKFRDMAPITPATRVPVTG
ncbi:LLM class flavin-dependent oxidoreductase [Streptomyces sp. NBC_01477]|uniref:LLM class flavin-dependent oxidoreductase n=1 Tax=Streptomyces sp. NBC_01477 TaxID=2976015 RepID=UPI002E32773D|nr:LLM class flavin-dependent oxidoreductase [Streptomyces sp. NBC_01477]